MKKPYREPRNYFPKEVLKEFGLGEYSEEYKDEAKAKKTTKKPTPKKTTKK